MELKFLRVLAIGIIMYFSRGGQCKNVVVDIIKSTKNIGQGVVQSAVDAKPTPWEVFDTGKQLLAGYPLAALFEAIDLLCSSVIAQGAVRPDDTPDIEKMSFQLIKPCNKYIYPLLEADKLSKDAAFERGKPVVILVSGWLTDVNDTGIIEAISKAYLCRGDVNLLAVDVGSSIRTLYTWSALNTDKIGELLAEGLVKLTKVVPNADIHLIGHSLGAQIVGKAGRHYHALTKRLLPRITGLDPANPCFNEGQDLSGLVRGDAAFIDVIHSNPGVLGKSEPLGDIDFYPGGLAPLAPGCLDPLCAHERSWMYYAESVYRGNEHNFMGVRCTSLKALKDGKCDGDAYPMGYAAPRNVKGNYFLEVNTRSPYGREASAGATAAAANCKPCS